MLKIIVYADAFNGKIGQTLAYMNFAANFGEVILVHPMNDLEFWLKHGDVLLVPGGADVSSLSYGIPPSFSNSRANAHYEYLDEHLLRPWLETGKPTIGICRGSQVINTILGGTLHQDIYGHVQSKDRHVRVDEMHTDVPGFEVHKINTFHHQAVNVLAEPLELVGWSTLYSGCPSLEHNKLFKHLYETDKDGMLIRNRHDGTPKKILNPETSAIEIWNVVTEAYKSKETSPYNIVAFQYHPEEFNCSFAVSQIRKLLQKAIPVLH